MNKPISSKERDTIQSLLDATRESGPVVRTRRFYLLVVPLLVFVAAVAVWLLNGGNTKSRYVTQSVERGDIVVIVTATGSVQPTNKVDVSSELSGTIRKVYVDYNSLVKAGQVLAELDTTKLVATLNSSRAKLVAAKAKVDEAHVTANEKERDFVRNKALAPIHAVSQKDHDQALAARDRALTSLESARADMTVAEADVQVDETNLKKASIISPIDGTVLTRSVDPGSTVAAAYSAPTLFTIAQDLRKMEVRVDVDEADVGKVRTGQSATFGVDAFPERRFPATIRYIRYSSETTNNVVTYKAVLDVDNSDLSLRPGMTATAEIKVNEVRNALFVPNVALRYSPSANEEAQKRSLLSRLLPGPPAVKTPSAREETGSNRTVWLLQDDKTTPVKITVGASDGKRTEVTDGTLHEGQAVIVDEATPK